MSLTEWRGLFATTCTPFAPRGSNKYKKIRKKYIPKSPNHQPHIPACLSSLTLLNILPIYLQMFSLAST